MSFKGEADRAIEVILLELDTVRTRLDQANDWPSDGETALSAAALAKKTKHLCRQASNCSDQAKLRELLAEATDNLRKLQTLLGID
jgi:hypothetical protein